MSGWGFDETGRAIDAPRRSADEEPDPLKQAARSQAAEIERAREAVQRDPTPESMPDLLRHARLLPDVEAALLTGADAPWDRWLPVLAHTRLDLDARRDLAAVAQRLPESARVQVLERVFRVPLGADHQARDSVNDLLDDAAESPTPDTESAVIEDDAGLHLTSADALVADLFDGPEHAEALPPLPAEEAQWLPGAETRLDVAGFVRACAPQVRDRGRAEAVLNQRFAGAEPPDEAAWWQAVRRLRRRFPVLVDALEAALENRSGAARPVIVQGGVARIDLNAGSLGVIAPHGVDA